MIFVEVLLRGMQAPTDIKQKQIIIFDLDGTLTESKSPMDAEMAELFGQLLAKKHVAVISGGGFGQFQKQLLATLKCAPSACANLFLFPTSASRFYQYKNGELVEVYADMMTPEERQKIKEAFKRAYEDVDYKHPAKVYGEVVEDRGTQVTFSALGQDPCS